MSPVVFTLAKWWYPPYMISKYPSCTILSFLVSFTNISIHMLPIVLLTTLTNVSVGSLNISNDSVSFTYGFHEPLPGYVTLIS